MTWKVKKQRLEKTVVTDKIARIRSAICEVLWRKTSCFNDRDAERRHCAGVAFLMIAGWSVGLRSLSFLEFWRVDFAESHDEPLS